MAKRGRPPSFHKFNETTISSEVKKWPSKKRGGAYINVPVEWAGKRIRAYCAPEHEEEITEHTP